MSRSCLNGNGLRNALAYHVCMAVTEISMAFMWQQRHLCRLCGVAYVNLVMAAM